MRHGHQVSVRTQGGPIRGRRQADIGRSRSPDVERDEDCSVRVRLDDDSYETLTEHRSGRRLTGFDNRGFLRAAAQHVFRPVHLRVCEPWRICRR